MMSWIKIHTTSCDHPKLKLIRGMQNGDQLALFWYLLLLQAGRCDREGAIIVTNGVPYTTEQLAQILGFPLPLVEAALKIFENMRMIELERGAIYISNWDKYQSSGVWEEKRKKDAERKRIARAKAKSLNSQAVNQQPQKLPPDMSADMSRDVAQQTRIYETIEEETTTLSDVMSLLPSGLKIPIKTVKSLAAKYGLTAVATAADALASAVAKGTKLNNPAGYLASLCVSFDPPDGYLNPAQRRAVEEGKQQRKATEEAARAEEERKTAEMERAREEYWQSLPTQERENWCERFAAGSEYPNLPQKIIEFGARGMSWEHFLNLEQPAAQL